MSQYPKVSMSLIQHLKLLISMKKRLVLFISGLIVLLMGGFIFTQTAVAFPPEAPAYEEQLSEEQPLDSSLYLIEKRIFQAFVQGIMSKDPQALRAIEEELDLLFQTSKQALAQYWLSYALYYESILHLQLSQQEEAERAVTQAIEGIESLKAMNSEDYALLALMKSFSIQFAAPMKAPLISGKSKKLANRALAIDEHNPRAYYVLASNDFYTPEQYGGGKVAEGYLNKCLALPAQAVENPYLPSWGRVLAHEMMLKLLMRQERWEDAKAHFKVANQEFPDSYQITQLGAELVSR